MTTEQIKEKLSYNYLVSIINRAGHKVSHPDGDSGVDFSIRRLDTIQVGENLRYIDGGGIVDIQHKFTTEKQIERVATPGSELIKYDLEVKTYNDLIYRHNLTKFYREPRLLLMVVVFPEDESEWLKLEISPEKQEFRLTFNAVGYWFYPSADAPLSERSSSKRIFIPASNVVDFQCMDSIFQNFKP